MGVSHKLHFKTLDQKGSTRIYMIMMVVMIVGMIFFPIFTVYISQYYTGKKSSN